MTPTSNPAGAPPASETLTRYALAAAARGWRVFPLRPGDKRPAAGFTDWERHATTDPHLIRSCWARGPFNIAIACGPSRLVVIDLDHPKPGETPPPEWDLPGVGDGADVLAVLCERHGQPWPADTFTVATRSGGTHLYFAAPDVVELRNTSGRHTTGLGWLIDTRAAGGYVVAPGSHVPNTGTAPSDHGGGYTVVHNAAPAPLPGWLCGLLNPAHRPSLALGCPSQSAGQISDLPEYVRAALKGETERVAGAARGGRNHALNKAAYNLGRLVGAGALPEHTAAAALYDAASIHFGPEPHGIPPAAAQATITAGLTAGARNPRTLNTAPHERTAA
ncbi:MAG TPA: bifunctional DNA primase/polymerase [Streptosporangiaceae bacterium]|nr:bifunctional DNA primase/polymerase [Streptosporangiaceae bacterium]